MTATANNTPKSKKRHPLQHFIAGGVAGLVESSICHPLDTIKTRMQLRRQVVMPSAPSAMRNPLKGMKVKPLHRASVHEPEALLRSFQTNAAPVRPQPQQPVVALRSLGPVGTATRIIEREGFTALYKGLTAVWTGIVPKMSIRFVSFELYRDNLLGYGILSNPTSATFVAGLFSGLTEAVLVVTPAEVCKIRMQAQYHSMMDPRAVNLRKYTNVLQTAMVLVKEEGLGALYKGVVPTMMRQGCNQAANFTAYNYGKERWTERLQVAQLAPWQHLILGGVSGGVGPCLNNPLDVVKTRMQKQVIRNGEVPKYNGLVQSCTVIAKEEGAAALWKGLTPRLMRIMPGQAITFTVYEAVSKMLQQHGVIPQF